MKKLSVLTPEQQLIKSRYQYPTTCKTYDKDGKVTSVRVVTHSIKATEDLRKLYPSLTQFINTYEDNDVVKAPKTIQQMFNSLGK